MDASSDSAGAIAASGWRAQVAGPELLRQILAAASGRVDFADMAQRLAGLITEATASDVCFVHVIDHKRHRLHLGGATPPFDVHVAGSNWLWAKASPAGWRSAPSP
jgi:hypothetical protein